MTNRNVDGNVDRKWVAVPVLDPALELRADLYDGPRDTREIPAGRVEIHRMLRREMSRIQADKFQHRLEAIQRRAILDVNPPASRAIFRMNPTKEVTRKN